MYYVLIPVLHDRTEPVLHTLDGKSSLIQIVLHAQTASLMLLRNERGR